MTDDDATDAMRAAWRQCGVAYEEQADTSDASPARRLARARRYSPYCASSSAVKQDWSTQIQGAVHDALQESSRHYDVHPPQLEPPMMRSRRALATKLQLATQSAANMAAYIERRRSATRQADNSNDRGGQRRVDAAEVTVCCICLGTNEPEDREAPVETLRCGHIFHRACIREWSRQRCCCPVDRLPLVEVFHDDQDGSMTCI